MELDKLSRKEVKKAVQREQLKRELESDFGKFLQYGFWRMNKKPFIYNHHHTKMINKISEVHTGDIINLIMNIPPRYSKTVLVIYFVAWTYAKNRRCNYIHLSYSDDLVKLNSDTIKDIIKSEWFQDLWPIQISKNTDSKGEWKIEDGGTFYAVATGGQITGRGAGLPDESDETKAYSWLDAYADYMGEIDNMQLGDDEFNGAILIDDPIKPIDATSEVILKKVNDRLNNTILSRKNSPKKTPVIIIMQRLHENDMTGFCMDGNTPEHWEQLKLSAIQIADDGTESALWEHKHSLEQLKEMKKTDPLVFSGQYEQNPSPLEGDLFKRDSWNIIEAIPKHFKCVRGYDLASSKKKYSAYTASVKMAKFDQGYIIFEAKQDRLSPAEVEAEIKLNASLDGYSTFISLPLDPAQAGRFQADYLIKALSGYMIEATPETGSKEDRARALSSQQTVGNVYLLKGDWNKEFIDQCTNFPNGKYKDMVDASSRAFHVLEAGGVSILDVL